ncbi:hypothetical protein KY316_01980 [Candidatus Woesearchaeota archaeon]|nr:hypothetical protein [Candidatus Woesearchaeota archaeon]
MSTAISMALIVVILIIIALFIGNSAKQIGEKSKDLSCRKSVEISTRDDIGISATSLDYAELINCPTHYLKIDTSDSNSANKAIAEELRKCWYKMGEGKLPKLFQHQDAVFCVVCSVIEEWEGGKPITNFDTWLKDNKIEGKDETYLEYLTGTRGTYQSYIAEQEILTAAIQQSFQNLRKIDTRKKYAVVYVHTKDAFEWDSTTQTRVIKQRGIDFWTAIKYAAGYVLGNDESVQYEARVVLVEYDEKTLSKTLKCQVLMD